MGSSGPSTNAAAAWRLGDLLTGTEAKQIADRLLDGDTLTAAMRAISANRRPLIRPLLDTVQRSSLVEVLRAIEGARATPTTVRPLWTMPGHVAQGGPLTSSVRHLVEDARHTVICSTYNFQRSSGLWAALGEAARRPEIALRVYLDAAAAQSHQSPSTTEIAQHLHPGIVLAARNFDGGYVRNHAKFVAIDHRFLMISSANFSWSAENHNIELGVIIDDRTVTEAVEREMAVAEDTLYTRIPGSR